MSQIMVTYDLKSPGQDYQSLHDAIKSVGVYWLRLIDSTWVVSGAHLSALSVSDALIPVIDKGDRLFCVDITGASRQGWLTEADWDWLRKH